MADPWAGASRSGAVACAGDWRHRGKAITIAQHGEHLLLEMGPDTPTLLLRPETADGAEVWPMRWMAVRRAADGGAEPGAEPVYVLELPTPTSPKLVVRKPAGDGMVVFEAVGRNGASDAVPTIAAAPVAASTLARKAAAAARSASRSGARARSRSPSRKKDGGADKFLPGDWSCPRCGDHQFARNTTCRSCGTGKPKKSVGLEGLVAQVKKGQRESTAFKEKWWDFANKRGAGLMDPARYDAEQLEEFLSTAPPLRGAGRAASRSGSRSGDGSSSGTSRRSSRRRSSGGGKRRRKTRRHRRKRVKRQLRRPRVKKRARSESSSAPSGLPTRKAAIKATKREIARAAKEVQKAKTMVAPSATEILKRSEDGQKEETEKQIREGIQRAEDEFTSRLQQAEEKLAEEKASRMREAEQRLDKAIEERLQEAERRLRLDLDARTEEARRRAAEASKGALGAAEARLGAEVEAATAIVQAAWAKVEALKASRESGGGKAGSSAEDGKNGKGASSAKDASDSEGSASSGKAEGDDAASSSDSSSDGASEPRRKSRKR